MRLYAKRGRDAAKPVLVVADLGKGGVVRADMTVDEATRFAQNLDLWCDAKSGDTVGITIPLESGSLQLVTGESKARRLGQQVADLLELLEAAWSCATSSAWTANGPTSDLSAATSSRASVITKFSSRPTSGDSQQSMEKHQ